MYEIFLRYFVVLFARKAKNNADNKKETFKLITSHFGVYHGIKLQIQHGIKLKFRKSIQSRWQWLARRRQKTATKSKNQGLAFCIADFAIALLTQSIAKISRKQNETILRNAEIIFGGELRQESTL